MSIIQEALKKSQGDCIKTTLRKKITEAAMKAPLANINTTKNIPAETSRRNPAFLPVLILAIIVSTTTIGLGLKTLFSNKEADSAKYIAKADEVIKGAPKDAKPAALNVQGAADKLPENIPAESQNTAAMHNEIPQPVDFRLNGTMYIGEKPRAIINGFIVEVGELVGGAKISAIKEDRVLLNYNGTEITLKLKE